MIDAAAIRSVILTLVAIAASPAIGNRPTDAAAPNVVLVMTDDQGYGDLACHGHPTLATPNLDALHADSYRWTDYHASPTCSPTRASLMTGRTKIRTGVWHTINGRSLMAADEVTLADRFRRGGYATGMFGKWHLGDNFPLRPIDRGFDVVVRHGGGGIGQTPDRWDNGYFDPHVCVNGHWQRREGFCTDVFFDAAIEFIEEQASADRPFFAYVATNAAHGPMHAPPEDAEPYRRAGHDVRVANFFGMIANLDRNVGRLVAALDAAGVAEDTVLIFTTDNGTAAGGGVHNAGMRGVKGSPYDGGHRVPMFIRYPRGGWVGGRDVAALSAHVDVVPTLIEMCGLTVAPEDPPLDGRSLTRTVDLDPAEDGRTLVIDSQRIDRPVKWRRGSTMRGRWRLVGGRELYDIGDDPGQRSDVSRQHPEIVAELRDAYERHWASLESARRRDVAIVVGHPAAPSQTLTVHDVCVTGEAATNWNQRNIREARKMPVDVHWNVDVATAGTYELRLGRWPPTVDAAADAPLAPGDPVPGEEAFRVAPGRAVAVRAASIRIGDQSRERSVSDTGAGLTFEVDLPAGPTRLTATLHTVDDEPIPAYYATVTKLR